MTSPEAMAYEARHAREMKAMLEDAALEAKALSVCLP